MSKGIPRAFSPRLYPHLSSLAPQNSQPLVLSSVQRQDAETTVGRRGLVPVLFPPPRGRAGAIGTLTGEG